MQLEVRRYNQNPILKPKYWWEEQGVFNPSVIFDNDVFHMIYRAQGPDRLSRFGYATSIDGKKFIRKAELPVVDIDLNNPQERLGIEDPRITKIGDTYYIVHTIASVYPASEKPHFAATSEVPWHVRVGLITTKDFKVFKRHSYILPDIDSRNATLFPVKFNDKFALIHRPLADIYISFSNNIEHFSRGELLMGRDNVDWQDKKIGICSQPLLTEFGWLLTFHGVDRKNYYRVGILLLNKSDPTQILYRSHEPILSPYKEYERSGRVPNVVFPTGLVEQKEEFYIYYGAADYSIGLATFSKNSLRDVFEKS